MEAIQTSTKFINEQKLPVVIEATKPATFEALLEYVRENRPSIEKKILTYGGVLFRGFPVEGPGDFNKVIDALGLGKQLSYVGGDSPRDKVEGKVYTSTEVPSFFSLPLHQEMSFMKNFPHHIYFYCAVPPRIGGETTIADARAIHKEINSEVREQFTNRGLTYISNFYKKDWLLDLLNRYMRSHKTWMDVLETKSKEEAGERCVANDMGYKWNKNDWLQVTYERPSVISHPKTGEKVWFNQAHLYDYNPRFVGGFWKWLGTRCLYYKKNTIMHEVQYGDGTKIAKKDLYHVMDVLEKETIRFPWKKGDVMVLDNVLAMHGRAPFSGQRRILVALTAQKT